MRHSHRHPLAGRPHPPEHHRGATGGRRRACPHIGLSAPLAAAAVLAVVSSCGEAQPEPRPERAEPSPTGTTYTDKRWGYSVAFPGTWHRAIEAVARELTEPREVLSLATFPLRYHPTDCEAFAGAARSDLGSHDAFLTVQERGYDPVSDWRDFPSRPEHFHPTSGEPAEARCGDPPGATVYWRNFTDAGRHFHTLVVIGPDAPGSVRSEAWRILDSLRLDPDRRPTWPASP
jgi:hypothetical protein